MSITPVYKWKSKKDSYRQALQHISDRKTGKITSLKCKSAKLNNATTDGFEIHTATCFAARPGNGKSVLKEQLIKEFFELNTKTDFRVLDFDLEMLPMVTALREFSSVVGKSYKHILSAEKENNLTKNEFEILKQHVAFKSNFRNTLKDYPIDIIEEAPTVEEFEETVVEYMEAYSKMDGDKKVYTTTVITLDHARLIRRNGRPETDMLYELGGAIIRTKKKYPIIYIILNHLNRSVTEATRCEDGKIGNLITDSDILGADSMLQSCDIVVAIDRPYKRKIRFYGLERFIVDEYMLIFHFLKVRNGDTRMSFFEGEFHKMQIVERDTPPTARDMKKARE